MKHNDIKLDIPFAPVAFRAKGETHLVYEMFIHNASSEEVSLMKIDISSHEAGEEIFLNLEGQGLEENLRYLNSMYRPAEEPKLIPDHIACAFFWLSCNPGIGLPKMLSHQVTMSKDSGAITEKLEIEVQKRTPLTIDPPLRGNAWLSANAASNTTGHRRTPLFIEGAPYFAQRYAVDWLQFGPDGRLFKDSAEKNENWYCYGANLCAVADGMVIEVQDGIIENVPLSNKMAVEINLQSAPGNYVLLDLGDENYALYAHMLPGSLQVQKGNHVKCGQVIGKVGNSGNSGAPHLHFHIGHRSSPLGTHGLPYHIRQFEWAGSAGGTEEMMAIVEKGESWFADQEPIRRKMELILENDVVNF